MFFQVFDREGDDGKFVSVTVKATDQGEPSLEGVCSFTVEITDVNDNPPLFDRQVGTLNLTQAFRKPYGLETRQQMSGSKTYERDEATISALCFDACDSRIFAA